MATIKKKSFFTNLPTQLDQVFYLLSCEDDTYNNYYINVNKNNILLLKCKNCSHLEFILFDNY